jgi:hypothetical protein
LTNRINYDEIPMTGLYRPSILSRSPETTANSTPGTTGFQTSCSGVTMAWLAPGSLTSGRRALRKSENRYQQAHNRQNWNPDAHDPSPPFSGGVAA